jgi:D-aminopeptidase
VGYVDLSINGVSIGEFGQLVLCASELGVRAIFGSGDLAFTSEAQAFVPGIETVWVKRGLSPGSGDELEEDAYRTKNRGAIHRSVVQARRLIRAGAARALARAQSEAFGIVPLTPPFERVARFRPNKERPYHTVSRETHPTSVIAVMNLPFERIRAPER